jgi:hypothetical protein
MKISTRTEEIPKRKWAEFFDEFSRRHEGWLVDVDDLSSGQGAQKEVSDLPFFGATLESGPKGGIILELGGARTAHLEHRITAPSRVWVESLGERVEASLEVESEGDRKTLVSFRAPQPPEAVDGLPGLPGRRPVRGISRPGKEKR